MLKNILILRDHIEEELANIDNLKVNLQEVDSKNLDKDIKTRLSASILDDFYLATEKIFKKIAQEIDEEIPTGSDWHKKLLRLMTIELSETRPIVIDKELFHQLEEYLRFRHLTRNIYGFQLDLELFEHLIDNLDQVSSELNTQLINFLDTIEEIARETDND
jgi:hypothetical protein